MPAAQGKSQETKVQETQKTEKKIEAPKDVVFIKLDNGKYKSKRTEESKTVKTNAKVGKYLPGKGEGKLMHVELTKRVLNDKQDDFVTLAKTCKFTCLEWPNTNTAILAQGWKVKVLHDGSKLLNTQERTRFEMVTKKLENKK